MGEVLDVAINLYFQHLAKLLAIAAAVCIPLFAIVLALDVVAFQEVSAFDPGAAVYEVGDSIRIMNESRFVIVQLAETVIAVIAYLLITGAAFRAASQFYLGGEPEAAASVRFAAARIHSLLWISLLLAIGVGVGFVILVLPGILLLVIWSVAIPAFMVEGVRGGKALGRSQTLVDKNWWRTFAALLVGLVFIGLFQFLLGVLGGAADGLTDEQFTLWLVLTDLLGTVATVITAPLQAAIVTVIYFNLRVRKEGFDLQLLAQGIEGVAAPPSTPPLPEG